MPFVITAVFLLAIVFIVFAVQARAVTQSHCDRNSDRDCSRRPERTP